MMQRSSTIIAAIVAALLVILAIVAGADAMHELHSMDTGLRSLSTRLDALEQMNQKLSETNRLLQTTNANLRTMVGASSAADKKLGEMRADLSVMSHKISGSFLFRGVK